MNFIANLAMQLSYCHPQSAAPQKKIFRESKRNIFIFNLREIVYMVRITLKTIMSDSKKNFVDLKRNLTQIIYTVQKFKCYYCFRLYRFLE